MSENRGSAQGPARKPGDSSDQLDNPPLWSSWNFQTKQREWHEVFYDEMRSDHVKNKNT
jgi:hypothetical protein